MSYFYLDVYGHLKYVQVRLVLFFSSLLLFVFSLNSLTIPSRHEDLDWIYFLFFYLSCSLHSVCIQVMSLLPVQFCESTSLPICSFGKPLIRYKPSPSLPLSLRPSLPCLIYLIFSQNSLATHTWHLLLTFLLWFAIHSGIWPAQPPCLYLNSFPKDYCFAHDLYSSEL